MQGFKAKIKSTVTAYHNQQAMHIDGFDISGVTG